MNQTILLDEYEMQDMDVSTLEYLYRKGGPVQIVHTISGDFSHYEFEKGFEVSTCRLSATGATLYTFKKVETNK